MLDVEGTEAVMVHSLSTSARNTFAHSSSLLGCGAVPRHLTRPQLLTPMFCLHRSVVVFAFMMLILVTLYTANTGELAGHSTTAPHAHGASAGGAAMA